MFGYVRRVLLLCHSMAMAGCLVFLIMGHVVPLSAADQSLREAAQTKDPLAVGNHLRQWLVTATVPLSGDELGLLARILQNPQVGHQAMQSLALSRYTCDIAVQYAQSDRGALLSAQILAVDAVLRRRFQVAFDRLPEPAVDDQNPLALRQTWQKISALTPDQQSLITTTLLSLVESRDQNTRAMALIAAANYGLASEQLTAAIEGVKDRDGPSPGARLLYLARIGQTLDPKEVEQGLSARKRQPPTIARTSPLLCLGSVVTPAPALTCEAIAEIQGSDAESYLPLLHEALNHDDLRVQIEAARALARIASSQSASALVKRLNTRDWPVFLEVSLALTHCRHRDVIPDLIRLLKGHNGRSRQYLLYALSAMTGNQYGKVTAEEWQTWWRENQDDFEIDDAASDRYLETYDVTQVSLGNIAAFYDLPIVSSALALVIDRSGSMTGERMETLIRNTGETLRSIEQGTHFNIIAYSSEFEMFSKQLTTDRRAAYDYVKHLTASGGTNIYDPSFTGLILPGIDSLYLLTDGYPGSGQFVNWNDITASMLLLNRYRPVAIHTVSFQAGVSVARQMQQLSLMTSGGHMNFE